MLSVLGHVLPLAVAAALSSVPITVMILILLSPKRTQSAVPFLVGWVGGMAVVVVAAALGASTLTSGPLRAPQEVIGAAEIVVGVSALALSVTSWRRSRRPGKGTGSTWLRSVASVGPLRAFGLAFGLNLRPKGLLLGAAAGLSVAAQSLLFGEALIVVCAYLVISTSTVVAPIIVTLAAPERMQPRLVSANEWLTRNGGLVTALVLLLIGVVIIGAGLSRF